MTSDKHTSPFTMYHDRSYPVFVLDGPKTVHPHRPLDADYNYDAEKQIWINPKSRQPLVTHLQAVGQSNVGETLITATREGTDQAEISGFGVSTFGETTMTKTHEGADQSEVIPDLASNFGETSIARTHEGADQSEVAA
jgi:hypothetical protein